MVMKVLLISSSRADFGHLLPLIEAGSESDAFELTIVSTWPSQKGSPFTMSAKSLQSLRSFGIDAPQTSQAWAQYLSDIQRSLDTLLQKEFFEASILLGDRLELLSLSSILLLHGVPIIHIHGGETTEGAVDNLVRDSLSKLSELHLVSREEHKQKLLAIGVPTANILVSGALAVDSLRAQRLLDPDGLSERLGFSIAANAVLATIHPVTNDETGPEQVGQFFDELTKLERQIIITAPNHDPGSLEIRDRIEALTSLRPESVHFIETMGTELYYSAIKKCSAVIGNSSSGIIDAPIVGTPSVDWGTRQSGRVAPKSVLRCPATEGALNSALNDLALMGNLTQQAKKAAKFYGSPGVASRILEFIRSQAVTLEAARNSLRRG